MIVDDAEGPKRVAARASNRGSGVEADSGFPRHHGVVAKARVLAGILDFEDLRSQDRVAAERQRTLGLGRLEPLS
jgi:molybdate-binding protein